MAIRSRLRKRKPLVVRPLLEPPFRWLTSLSHSYYGPPQPGYGPPPMQYQQAPPPQRQSKERGCLGSLLACLCCCFVCEEGCEW